MYHLTVPTTPAVSEDALSASVEASLRTLRQLGYVVEVTDHPGSSFCQVSIALDGKELFFLKEQLTPNAVKSLSRFTERASVQHALNSIYARMVAIGWGISIKKGDLLTDDRIEVEHADGTTTIYSPTNAEMVRLRQDLDIAETNWIIGDKMPLFLELDWIVQTGAEGGYYILTYPDGGFDTVTIGRVDQAKYVVDKAEKELIEKKAAAQAAQIADQLGQ